MVGRLDWKLRKPEPFLERAHGSGILFKSPHLFKARLFSQAILDNLQSEADQLE